MVLQNQAKNVMSSDQSQSEGKKKFMNQFFSLSFTQISNLRLQAKKELLFPSCKKEDLILDGSNQSDILNSNRQDFADDTNSDSNFFKPFGLKKGLSLVLQWQFPDHFLHKVLHLYLLRAWTATFKLEHQISKLNQRGSHPNQP